MRGSITVASSRLDTEFCCTQADLSLVSQDGQVGDPALQQAAGRLEDAVVVTFGQDDVFAIRTSPLLQLVGEHLRCDHGRDGNSQLRQQVCYIDVTFISSNAVSILR